MSVFKELNVRPFRASDVEQLDSWRERYWDGDLEVVHGYLAPGVETAIAEKDNQVLGAVTAVSAVVIDFIKNPDAKPLDIYAAVYALERALTYVAQRGGTVDAYAAVPAHLTAYHEILKKAGYEETCQSCKIFRRPLRKEIVPRLGDIRDAVSK